jgi:hypothetical protein
MAWKQAVDYQIDKLKNFVYIDPRGKKRLDIKVNFNGSNTSKAFPNFKTHHDSSLAWKTAGYEDIDIQLICPAIISTDPQNKRSPYKLNNSELGQVKIKEKFAMKVYFPRGYPDDKIAWGIFFSEAIHLIPSYPNISKRRSNTDPLNFFSNYPPAGNPQLDGMICLGVSIQQADISAIFQDLVRFLLMDDVLQFTRQSDKGHNDGGYDGGLLDHYFLNFNNLKSQIDSFKGTGSISFKPEKGPGKRISFR